MNERFRCWLAGLFWIEDRHFDVLVHGHPVFFLVTVPIIHPCDVAEGVITRRALPSVGSRLRFDDGLTVGAFYFPFGVHGDGFLLIILE